MIKAIGLMELNSIAKGYEVADAMLKSARVEIYMSTPICPGKYVTLIYGDVASVENAIKTGIRIGEEAVIDDLVIPNIEEQIFPAITGTTAIKQIDAVGVIESLSIASLIMAADAATKEANVQIIEIRLGSGLGGKAYVSLTGDVADVRAAVANGVEAIRETGNLVYFTVIPSPHGDFKDLLF
ncbi:MAG: BMC domain-containing protein [Coriobacteriales bacterium]|jgi:microcompartment protein CcmL/EutN|nr:BMC domain-containing protein [Coriobacteriales bacterium]